jgi:hypothetical protein
VICVVGDKKFDVLTAVRMLVVIWVVTPFGLVGRYFSPEDGDSMFLRSLRTSPDCVITQKTDINI